MKETIIISAFPGIGKTKVFENNKDLIILDSDSSKFSWIYPAIPHKDSAPIRDPSFPQNYMNHIKNNIGKADIIMISCHSVVRDALKKNGIKYFLIYPTYQLRDHFIQRYKDRGNTEAFVKFMEENYNKFIFECDNESATDCTQWQITKPEEYLSDILHRLQIKNGKLIIGSDF
jgi:hypothetical protein